MTLLSELSKPPEHTTGSVFAEQMDAFIEGVKRGIEARSQGKVQPLEEVVAEFGIT